MFLFIILFVDRDWLENARIQVSGYRAVIKGPRSTISNLAWAKITENRNQNQKSWNQNRKNQNRKFQLVVRFLVLRNQTD